MAPRRTCCNSLHSYMAPMTTMMVLMRCLNLVFLLAEEAAPLTSSQFRVLEDQHGQRGSGISRARAASRQPLRGFPAPKPLLKI